MTIEKITITRDRRILDQDGVDVTNILRPKQKSLAYDLYQLGIPKKTPVIDAMPVIKFNSKKGLVDYAITSNNSNAYTVDFKHLAYAMNASFKSNTSNLNNLMITVGTA
jgi:hypothetical protein